MPERHNTLNVSFSPFDYSCHTRACWLRQMQSTMYKLMTTTKHISPRLQQSWPLRVQELGASSFYKLFSGSSDDTHDDFKPQIKNSTNSLAEQIKHDVNSHKVFVYMKGVPESPMCGFSNMACKILDAYGVDFGSANVLSDPELRESIKQYTHWPTIPQVFIKGEFIGGSDILYQLHQTGELTKLLQD